MFSRKPIGRGLLSRLTFAFIADERHVRRGANVKQIPLSIRTESLSERSPTRSRCRHTARPSQHRAVRVGRILGPALLSLSITAVAHAQGTMDFSGAQTLMSTFRTFAMYAGAVICLGGLIFAGIRMMSGRFQDAIPGLFGALFGAGVLGWGAGWISSLTGQSM